jgi:hypothetical protein
MSMNLGITLGIGAVFLVFLVAVFWDARSNSKRLDNIDFNEEERKKNREWDLKHIERMNRGQK